MLKNGLMVTGALVLGFVGSSWWSARAAQKAVNHPAPPAEVALSPTSATPPSLDLGALRAMIREEVQQSRSGVGAPKTPEPDSASGASSAEAPESPKQPERPRTPEQVTAQTEAATLIDDGLASGHWRDEDERRWLELRGEMAKADAVALRLKLFQALNEGRIAGDFDIRAGGRPRMSEATQ